MTTRQTAERLAFAAAMAPRGYPPPPRQRASLAAELAPPGGPLRIVAQPFIRGDGVLALRASLRLNVEAAGSSSLAYEWRHNGAAVQHTRSSRADLILRSIGFDDQGEYQCIVSCGGASLASDVVVLRVAGAAADDLLRARSVLARGDALLERIADVASAASEALLAARECEALRAGCSEAATLAALPCAERARLHYIFARAAVETLRASSASSEATAAAAARAAVASCDAALDALPGCIERVAVLRLRAEAYLRLGRFTRAINDFEAAAAAAAAVAEEEKEEGGGRFAGIGEQVLRDAAFAARATLREEAAARWEANPPPPRRPRSPREESECGADAHSWRSSPPRSETGSGSRSAGAPPEPSREQEPAPCPPPRRGAASARSVRFLATIGLTVPTGFAKLPSTAAVRKAYRREARRRHPDKPGGGTEAFQALASEYAHYLQALSHC